jgi:aminoglycoside phosphotransferase (APT) family kinase protein
LNDDRRTIDIALVRALVDEQFPEWRGVPISRVEWDGWDNSTFRLGDRLKVRLPTASRYIAQVEKENRWLPLMAPHLPLIVPKPMAVGAPAHGYPWPWSVYEWIEGETSAKRRIADINAFAANLAGFLRALWQVDATGGPPAGPDNFFRGGSLAVYHDETMRAIGALAGEIDTAGATAVWDLAMKSERTDVPVWVHGDIAVGNLLVKDGQLHAVIDFGSSAVGDPACDLVIAWTFLEGESRHIFKAELPPDEAMWARARGWALWKALITQANHGRLNPDEATPLQIVSDVVTEVGSV